MKSLLLLFFSLMTANLADGYRVGVAIADATGPAAEINIMGYGQTDQQTSGIHLRQFSRAFVIVDDDDDNSRVVLVVVDIAHMDHLIKRRVMKRLRGKFGDIYSDSNVMLMATHTHGGPSGYSQYVLFHVLSLGVVHETVDAIVDGIVHSIERAHENVKDARVTVSSGHLENANINRSPTSYLSNPEEEIELYKSDRDTLMTQLNFFDLNTDKPMGVLNFFAAHPTSMNNSNTLISSDNKGVASLLLEQDFNPPHTLPGQGEFVAAFGNANSGDLSPNLDGPKCQDTGLPCDLETSTCGGSSALCIASGPGKDMFESTFIIGDRQYRKAKELLESEGRELKGALGHVHEWIDMNERVLSDGAKTCKAALGYAFAAGTTDGPGAFDFIQGTNDSSIFWDIVSSFLVDPSPEQERCHEPKPILISTGEIKFPYEWSPNTIDTQIFRIDDLFVVGLPSEFTTMAGRRLRNRLVSKAESLGLSLSESDMMLGGFANLYSQYVVTREEYAKQRYEAGATLYGPNTLQAYEEQYEMLIEKLIKGESVDDGEPPVDLDDEVISLQPGVIVDTAPIGQSFGDCLRQPDNNYGPGDIVSVEFVSANPRNDRMLDSSFVFVEKLDEAKNEWVARLSDANWETKREVTRGLRNLVRSGRRPQSKLNDSSIITSAEHFLSIHPQPKDKGEQKRDGKSHDSLIKNSKEKEGKPRFPRFVANEKGRRVQVNEEDENSDFKRSARPYQNEIIEKKEFPSPFESFDSYRKVVGALRDRDFEEIVQINDEKWEEKENSDEINQQSEFEKEESSILVRHMTPFASVPYDLELAVKRIRHEHLLQALCTKRPREAGRAFTEFARKDVHRCSNIEEYSLRNEFSCLHDDESNEIGNGSRASVGFFVGSLRDDDLRCVNPSSLKVIPESHKRVVQVFETFLRNHTTLKSFDAVKKDNGHYRNLITRSNYPDETGVTVLITMHPQQLTESEILAEKEKLMDYFKSEEVQKIVSVDSLLFHLNSTNKDMDPSQIIEPLWGSVYNSAKIIIDGQRSLSLRVNVSSPLLSNIAGLEELLLPQVLRMAYPKSDQVLIDINCGIGVFTLAMANKFGACVGIDASETNIEDANVNRQLSGVSSQCTFVCGHVVDELKRILNDLEASNTFVSVVINGRGSGVERDIIHILRMSYVVKRVVFISMQPEGPIFYNMLQLMFSPKKVPNPKSVVKTSKPFSLMASEIIDVFPRSQKCQHLFLFRR